MAGRHGNKGVVSRILPTRTCRTSRTGSRSTSCSTRSAFRGRMNVGPDSRGFTSGGRLLLGKTAQDSSRRGTKIAVGRGSSSSSRSRANWRAREEEFVEELSDKGRPAGPSSERQHQARDAGLRRAHEGRDQWPARHRGVRTAKESADEVAAHRRTAGASTVLFDGRTGEAFDRERHGRRDVRPEAAPPRGRQDPRARHRAVLAGHPAAPRRQGAVRRSASRRRWKSGRWKPTALRLALRVPHRPVGRRARTAAHVRVHREGESPARSGLPSRSTCLMKSFRRSVTARGGSRVTASSSRDGAGLAAAQGDAVLAPRRWHRSA